MAFAQSSRRDRIAGALAAVVVQVVVGYALISGLAVGFGQAAREALATFSVLPPPPRPAEKLQPKRVVSRKAEGAASSANLRSKATDIVAPRPVIPPPVPPPIVTAEKAGVGDQSMSGNADVPGPGTGSGGIGEGTGSGRYGDGAGDGGRETAPRQTKGMKRGDYPSDLADAGIGGTVGVRYTVTVDGRATGCRITRSSGSRALDVRTCELIELRFRFRPALDEDGRPVQSVLVHNWSWINGIDD